MNLDEVWISRFNFCNFFKRLLCNLFKRVITTTRDSVCTKDEQPDSYITESKSNCRVLRKLRFVNGELKRMRNLRYKQRLEQFLFLFPVSLIFISIFSPYPKFVQMKYSILVAVQELNVNFLRRVFAE